MSQGQASFQERLARLEQGTQPTASASPLSASPSADTSDASSVSGLRGDNPSAIPKSFFVMGAVGLVVVTIIALNVDRILAML